MINKKELVLKPLMDENIISIKALLRNGFQKKGDGDYRKVIIDQYNNTWIRVRVYVIQ